MAEKAAHLTQTHQLKPSIFDFIAQESLESLLHPALERIVNVLSERNEISFISKWFDELYYSGHFFLQLHYLKKFGATFSEAFYGLKRISVKNGASPLTKKEILLSLMFCSVLPYLRLKLNKISDLTYFDAYKKKGKKKLLLSVLVLLNKNFNIPLHLITFVQYLRFLSGKSEYISPFLWASALKLEYSTEQDFSREGLTFRNFLPQVLRRSLELTAFFIQFCQWWQTERVGSLTKLSIPPPPQINENGSKFAGLCPICGDKRKLETVLSVSGYIFCFRCISEYIQSFGRCPVTNLPASTNNLIRLYPLN